MKYTRFLAGMAILAVVFVSPAFADEDNDHMPYNNSLVFEVPLAWQDAGYGESALTRVYGFSTSAVGCAPSFYTECKTMGISFFNLVLSQNIARKIWDKNADRQFGFGLAMFEPGIVFPLDENRRRGWLSLSALLGQAISSGHTKTWVGGAAYGVRLGLTAPVSKSMVVTVSMRVIGSSLRDFQDLFGTHIVISSLGLGMSF